VDSQTCDIGAPNRVLLPHDATAPHVIELALHLSALDAQLILQIGGEGHGVLASCAVAVHRLAGVGLQHTLSSLKMAASQTVLLASIAAAICSITSV
jgi:hypothetical protein